MSQDDAGPDRADGATPIVVPHAQLSAEAVRGVVESFVLREGTDYGERDVTLDTKVAQVMAQLERGEAEILYDSNTESIDIVVRRGRA